MLGLLMTFSITGLMIIGLSVPLIMQWVAPNQWYGFRIRATLSDTRIWYPANAYAAWRLLWTGVLILVLGVIGYFVPNLTLDQYGLLVSLATLAGIIVTLVQSFLFVSKLTKQIAVSGPDQP